MERPFTSNGLCFLAHVEGKVIQKVCWDVWKCDEIGNFSKLCELGTALGTIQFTSRPGGKACNNIAYYFIGFNCTSSEKMSPK